MLPGLDAIESAGLFIRFVPVYLCLELNYVAPPSPFSGCVCHLPHVSYLFDEGCTHRAHVDRNQFLSVT